MGISESDRKFMQEVLDYFKSASVSSNMPHGSIRNTARHFSLTRTKVIKILVTLGAYENEEVRAVRKLRAEGLGVSEIAIKLGISSATVSSFLPYHDIIHGTLEPQKHTRDVRGYRAYEKKLKQRMEQKQSEYKNLQSKHGALGDAQYRTVENLRDFTEATHTLRDNDTVTLKDKDMVTDKTNSKKAAKLSRKIGEYLLPSNLLRLHIVLEKVDVECSEVLKQYGGVTFGRSISRDIIIPEDMPLRALHHVIQRAFGFMDMHLHRFEVDVADLKRLTRNHTGNLLNLLGTIFCFDEEEPLYKDEIYRGGSIKKWLRKRYTEPYNYWGARSSDFFHEDENSSKKKILLNRYCQKDDKYYRLKNVHSPDPLEFSSYYYKIVRAQEIDGLPGVGECVKWVKDENTSGLLHLERCDSSDAEALSFKKVSLKALGIADGIHIISDLYVKIIERLAVSDVIAASSDYLPFDDYGHKIHTTKGLVREMILDDDRLLRSLKRIWPITPKPFCETLFYRYDYGDGWKFSITASHGCSDLIEKQMISETRNHFQFNTRMV